MPTRQLERYAAFDVQNLYANFLSSQAGWSGGSAEDIESIEWDKTLRTLKITRVREGLLKRWITYTDAEIWNLVKNLSGWTGGTAADIAEVVFDAAGRRIVVVRVPKGA